MSRLADYLAARWRVRTAEMLAVVGRVRMTASPHGEGWAAIGNGLHLLHQVDRALFLEALSLIQASLDPHDYASLRELARFERRIPRCGLLEDLPPTFACGLRQGHRGAHAYTIWTPARRDEAARSGR